MQITIDEKEYREIKDILRNLNDFIQLGICRNCGDALNFIGNETGKNSIRFAINNANRSIEMLKEIEDKLA